MNPSPREPNQVEDALARKVARLVLKNWGTNILLEMTLEGVWMLASTISLALKHPRNKGPVAKQMQWFLEKIIAEMGTIDPELGKILHYTLIERPDPFQFQ